MIPFKGDLAISNNPNDFCIQKRLKEILEFMDKPEGKIVDFGEPNLVGEAIERHFHVSVLNFYGVDFNLPVYAPVNDCGTVLCFEVIEHVMNPLVLAQTLAKMTRRRGILYLSTPLHNRFGFFFNDTEHFVEYRADKLITLMEYVGFRVERKKVFRSIPFIKGMIHGGGIFRTTFRVLSTKTQLYKFRRI